MNPFARKQPVKFLPVNNSQPFSQRCIEEMSVGCFAEALQRLIDFHKQGKYRVAAAVLQHLLLRLSEGCYDL